MTCFLGAEVFAVVCDGVTVGRPTCGIAHCTSPLATTKEVFCAQHQGFLQVCRIVGCSEPIKQGFKTCGNDQHCAAEGKYNEAGQAAFQLKKRFEHSVASATAEEDDEELDIGYEGIFEADGNESDANFAVTEELDTADRGVAEVVEGGAKKPKKLRGQFGRKRTHNEQLIIAPCGMILARRTFPHSEAFSLVAVCV